MLKLNSFLMNEVLCVVWKGMDGKLRVWLRVVRNGERLDLGGRILRFMFVFMLCWLDLIFVCDEKL